MHLCVRRLSDCARARRAAHPAARRSISDGQRVAQIVHANDPRKRLAL